jgi:hypothetical protein
MDSLSNRYEYPAYHTEVIAKHPLSRLWSPVRGPALSPERSAHGLDVVSRAVLAEEENFRFQDRVYSDDSSITFSWCFISAQLKIIKVAALLI